MTSTAPSTKDTARKPRIALTGQRGTYRVESQTTPGVFYTTTAARCSCPARKPCKHMHYVKGLNRAFFTKKEATAPVAPVAPVADCSLTRILTSPEHAPPPPPRPRRPASSPA